MTQSPPTPAQGNSGTQSGSSGKRADSAFKKLREQLGSRFPKTRKAALQSLLEQGEAGLEVLQETLLKEAQGSLTWLSGSIYVALKERLETQEDPAIQSFLAEHFPKGVVPLKSELGVDYSELYTLLLAKNYQEADRLTNLKLCELAGPVAEKRKWVYFSDVPDFPVTDLQTLDLLWNVYSEGNFGFSAQRELWLGVGQNWEQLWPKIGWKDGNKWTRYPGAFTWDLSAPKGHLPLFNQLRGVRVMDALMNHPAFAKG